MRDPDANFECVDCGAEFAHTPSGACLDCGGRLRDGDGQVIPVASPEPNDADDPDESIEPGVEEYDDAPADPAPSEVTVDRTTQPRSPAFWISVGMMATAGLGTVGIGAFALGQNSSSVEPVAVTTTTTRPRYVVRHIPTTTTAPSTATPPVPAADSAPAPATSPAPGCWDESICAGQPNRDYWEQRDREQQEERERREREQWEQERERWEREQEEWQYEQEQRQNREDACEAQGDGSVWC